LIQAITRSFVLQIIPEHAFDVKSFEHGDYGLARAGKRSATTDKIAKTVASKGGKVWKSPKIPDFCHFFGYGRLKKWLWLSAKIGSCDRSIRLNQAGGSMTNTEEHLKILKKIEGGKISAEEGAKILAKLSEGGQRVTSSSNPGRSAVTGRLLHIRVTDIATGRSKASVQIPVGLVEAGMNMGAQFAPEVTGVDLTRVQEAIRAGVIGKVLDVTNDKDNEHVEIYVE
jgi:hypothetical protein